MNGSYAQLQGPFNKNEDIITIMKLKFENSFRHLKRIGIQTKPENKININGQIFEIGQTGILEFNEVEIISLYFMQDEPESTIIDCIVL